MDATDINEALNWEGGGLGGPTAIPTLSQWSLMVLGALLALVGLRAHRRRAAG